MAIQRHVGCMVILSCYVFGLWRVFHIFYVEPQSLPAPTFAVSTDDWNTLIKDNDSYYAQDMVELNQFRKAAQKAGASPHRPAHRVDDFKYNIKSACDANGIIIIINELYHANHTRGGSSFRVVSTSAMLRQTCSFHDFFNGTYVAFCLIDQADCINVTIYIMYVDFTAYTDKIRPMNKFLWSDNVYSTRCNGIVARQFPYPPTALQKRVQQQNRMTWRANNGSSQLFIRGSNSGTWKNYQPINKPDLCRWVYTTIGVLHVNITCAIYVHSSSNLRQTVCIKTSLLSIGYVDVYNKTKYTHI